MKREEIIQAIAEDKMMPFIQPEQLAQIVDFVIDNYQQPMPNSTQLIELWHEDKEMLKEKDFRGDQWRLAYNAFMCGFGRDIAVKKQEQLEPTCKTCGFYENNCPFIRGKFIPYPNKVCKDYIHSAMKEQEHPEVDLEKEVNECWDYVFSAIGWDENSLMVMNHKEFLAFARHFANLSLTQ